MQKNIILFALIVFLIACAPSPPAPQIISTQKYVVRQEILVVNRGNGSPEQQNLWVALIRNFAPYQQVHSRSVSPAHTLVIDEYGNEYAEFDFSGQPAGTQFRVEIDYEISVNELAYDISKCTGSSINEYLSPELHIESANPQITALAAELGQNQNPCLQARAFYNYAAENLIYTFNQKDWGAQATMGFMGSDCTEYADLVIALNRASGIPARYFEGLLYLDENRGDLAHAQHAWLDAYLPGIGWVAMDPTLGRSANIREHYFAHYTPDHIIVTEGRNPSTLRGASYFTHLYWPGNSTKIKIEGAGWEVEPIKWKHSP